MPRKYVHIAVRGKCPRCALMVTYGYNSRPFFAAVWGPEMEKLKTAEEIYRYIFEKNIDRTLPNIMVGDKTQEEILEACKTQIITQLNKKVFAAKF